MRRISRLPFRALLHQHIAIPHLYRTQCTTSRATPETHEGRARGASNARRLMEDPTNKHLRDEYHNSKGEVIFEHDPNKPLSEDDWCRFETAFGLDKPISKEEIRKWEALIEEGDASEVDMPFGAGSVFMGPSEGEKLEPKRESKQSARAKRETAKRRPRSDSLEHGLRQPLHRRPGYEKRVAAMEAEMTRLVTDILIERGSDWYTAGADIQRVMLTPNLRNLTIHYTVDEEAEDMGRKEWRRLNKEMSTRIHKEIFKRMDVRYVPNVFFERVSEDNKTAESALDEAFARIEAERQANSMKPA